MVFLSKYIYGILIILFLGYVVIGSDKTIPKFPWMIEDFSPALLQYIESNGGRVASVRGKKAIVYLSDDLKQELVSAGYQLESRLTVQKSSVKDLVDDYDLGESYHTYEAVLAILDSLHGAYPEITLLETIGYTVQNREIKAICLSNNVLVEEAEPELRFIGNMHGNEIITQELMLCAIDSLLRAYGNEERITQLLDQTEIWFVPNLNFDGSEIGSRFNANGIDLNRDFPDREFDSENDPTGREPETQAVMQWSEDHNFVLCANFHAGAQLVNYPWDKNLTGQSGYAATPDDSVFIRMALSYARHNPLISGHPEYVNGIVNGALWYEIDGSLEDWSYHFMNGFEVTIEISDTLQPAPRNIKKYWKDNSHSLFSYIEQVHSGLRGIVTDSLENSPLLARVEVLEIGKEIYSDPDLGDYYRLLRPGEYSIRFSASGYYPKTYNNVYIDSIIYTSLDVKLRKETFYTLQGMVVDSLSGLPLDNVTLYFYRKGLLEDSVSSDPDGSFQLDLPQDSYLMIAGKNQYFQISDSLYLYKDQAIRLALIPILPTAIRGTVSLQDGGNPSGTVVYCQSNTDSLKSSSNFLIDGINAPQINIFAFRHGYITAHIDTNITNGDTLTINITLVPGLNEYLNDFENDYGLFIESGDWQAGQPISGPGSAWSGAAAYGTNLQGDYSTGPALSSLTTPFLFIQGMAKPAVEFYQWYSIEDGYDGGNIKLSTDEGKSWQIVDTNPYYNLTDLTDDYNNPLAHQPVYSGKQESWQNVLIHLDEYEQYPALLLRFDFGADQQKEAAGWFIDHFKVFDANATDLVNKRNHPNDFSLSMRVYPNPANPHTTVEISGIKKGSLDLKIFSITGKLIISKRIKNNSDGNIIWKWDGQNNKGYQVSSGVYFIKIRNDERFISSKVLMIR